MEAESSFIIYTKLLGKKQYVVDYQTRKADLKHIITLSENKNKAVEFSSQPVVTDFLNNILNPYNRSFIIENVTN